MRNAFVSIALTSLAVLLAAPLAGCRAIERVDPAPPLEALDAVSAERVLLGRDLFFDARLSADGTISCATCHKPEAGGADDHATSKGVGGQQGRRNTPSVFNAGFKQHLFWDGRAATLEEQALGPLRAENEMAADEATVLRMLGEDARYRDGFARAFPGDPAPISMPRLAEAIAAYERQLVTPSRVDRFLSGDTSALDARERRGLDLFNANCAFCHDGPGVGGQRFEKLGDDKPWPAERSEDLGRFEETGDEGDKLVFAVPQLRNVARTAPYFHDGSVPTLEEAVKLMGWHQVGERFEDEQIADIVAFLEALSADPEPVLLRPE